MPQYIIFVKCFLNALIFKIRLCSELRKIEEKVPSPLSRTQSMGDSDEESLQTGGSEEAEQFDFIPEHDECEHSEQRVFTRGEDQEVVFISSAEARKQSAELGRRTVTELNSRRPTFPKKELSLFDIAEYDIDTDGTNS